MFRNPLRGRKKSQTSVPRRRLSDTADNISYGDEVASQPTPSQGTYESRRRQFRRNQTITGSTSSGVASAGEQAGQLQSARTSVHTLKQTRRRLSQHLGGLMLLSVAVLGLLYTLIADVQVTYMGQITDSGDFDSIARHQEHIQEYLGSRPLERIRPFLDTDSLTMYLQETGSPEVEVVSSVVAGSIGTAHVQLKLREPVATWIINGERQFVDRSGNIFGENHYPAPTVSVVDESGVRADDIRTVTSGRFLQFIGVGLGYARTTGLPVSEAIIPTATTRQVQFALDDENTTRIKLSIDRPVGEQIEDALRAYRHLQSRDEEPEYIDVRVSGRAYWR